MSDITRLIEQLMVADNSIRSSAESNYQSMKTQNPEVLTLSLQSVIEQVAIPIHFRQLAAVLLRQLLIDETESFFGKLSSDSKVTLKTSLLKSLDQESDLSMKARICDIVGELVGFVLEDSEWPEILPYIYSNVQSPDPIQRETGLTLLGMVSNALTPILINPGNIPAVISVFQNSLSDQSQQNGRINLASIRALSTLLSCVPQESQLSLFQPLVEPMFLGLNLTTQLFVQGHASLSVPCAYVETLIDISDDRSSLYGPQLPSILPLLMNILEDVTHIPPSLRHLIVEFLVCICSGIPKVVRKLKGPLREDHYFPLRVFSFCAHMMASLPEDPTWETLETDEQDCNESGLDSEVAESALDRMTRSLGLRSTMSIVSSNIQGLLQSSNWKEQYAGLKYLGNYLEMTARITDKQQLLQHRSEVVGTLTTFALSSHPRVRGAAFYAISNFFLFHGQSSNLGSGLSSRVLLDEHVDRLLTVIIQNSSVTVNRAPRVRRFVLMALINMIDSSSQSRLVPRLSMILSSIVQALSEGPQFVQETALLGITSLTETIQGEQIASYYDALMPILKELLQSAQSKGNASLWGLTLSCCAALGEASGKHKFSRDAMEMMGGLVSIQQQYQQYLDHSSGVGGGNHNNVFYDNMEDAKKYLMRTWVRIARCLGVEFVPFLQPVMEKLLASVSQDVTIPGSLSSTGGGYGFGGSIEQNDEEENDDEDDDDDEDEDIQMVEGDQGWFKARTTLVEEVAASMQLILLISERLQEHFYPYVEVTVRTITPLLQSPFEDIRSYAIVLIPELVRSAAKFNCRETSPTALMALSQFVLGQLVQTVQTDSNLELIMTGLQALKQVLIFSCTNWLNLMTTRGPENCMDEPPPIVADTSLRILNSAQMEALTLCAKEVMKDSIQRRAVMRAEAKISSVEASGGGGGSGSGGFFGPGEGLDEDDRAEEEDFMKESMELHYNVSELIGTIFKTHGSDYLSIFETHWNEIIMQMTLPYCLKEDRQFATYVICDVIEFGLNEQNASRYLDSVMPTLCDICAGRTGLTATSSPSASSGIDLASVQNPGPRQAASYAIGRAAIRFPQIFATKFALPSLQSLFACITLGECGADESFLEEENEDEQPQLSTPTKGSTGKSASSSVASRGPCVDNAVSSVGMILETMERLGGRGTISGSLSYSFLWGQWLNYLPLRHDIEEGFLVLKRLIRLLSLPLDQSALLCSTTPTPSPTAQLDEERLGLALNVLVTVIDSKYSNPTLNTEIFTFLHSIRPLPSSTSQSETASQSSSSAANSRLSDSQLSRIVNNLFSPSNRLKFERILQHAHQIPPQWTGTLFLSNPSSSSSSSASSLTSPTSSSSHSHLSSPGMTNRTRLGSEQDSSPGPSAPIHDILFRKM